ncbi:serine/threonine protein kinase [Polyangium aurulentum]|uniref:serine/threonine protein kinase n=1 Tax=Polyangium aurulentum TaxID=2567896 RepID=UPI0010AE79EF|nr:serine/threonine-protein kinase [Polyangium aurulentum]UQA55478.1 protein kinase [Polyangium aurulentum]
MSMLMLAEGVLFANRYRVGRCIAMGGMGAVYEVVHLETQRRRALKVMLPHLVESPELRERFRAEAQVAAQIESEFIVDVFDAGVDEATGMPFLVMELLRGEELSKRLGRMGRLPPGEVVRHLWQTALALDKTHRARIVHRDLKPENLFLIERDDGPPQIKVLDFGIAKFIAEGSTHANSTRSLGTPLYMAPEQFLTESSVSPASDIYSLGMIAYTLLVGAAYWREEKRAYKNVFAFSAMAMLGPQEPATVRAARFDVILPPDFDVWFRTATALRPEARFATATAAVQALAEVLGLPPMGQQQAPRTTLVLGVDASATAIPLEATNPTPQTIPSVRTCPPMSAPQSGGTMVLPSSPSGTAGASTAIAVKPRRALGVIALVATMATLAGGLGGVGAWLIRNRGDVVIAVSPARAQAAILRGVPQIEPAEPPSPPADAPQLEPAAVTAEMSAKPKSPVVVSGSASAAPVKPAALARRPAGSDPPRPPPRIVHERD